MQIAAGFLIALAGTTMSGVSFAESMCDRPNGTVIMVRQENLCDRNGVCTNVSFSLERDGNKMRGGARYSAPGGHGLVTGEIGSNGGMYWQVVWDNGEIGTYKGTLVNGVGEGFTHGDKMLYYKYIAETAEGCARWSYVDPAAPPAPPAPPKKFIKSIGKAKTYAGNWRTVANGGSWSFDMTFTQKGAGVSGDYVVIETGAKGSLTGSVSAGVLNFTWKDQSGYAGTGSLRLSPDGKQFDGTYVVTFIPEGLTADLVQGTWHGTIQKPLPDTTTDYGSCPGCEAPEEFPVVK